MSIPLPGKDFVKTLVKNCINLFDKAEKIKRGILSQSKVNGRLKMPNIANFIYSLKCFWIRRIIVSPTRPWVMLFESSYCSSRLKIKFLMPLGKKFLRMDQCLSVLLIKN